MRNIEKLGSSPSPKRYNHLLKDTASTGSHHLLPTLLPDSSSPTMVLGNSTRPETKVPTPGRRGPNRQLGGWIILLDPLGVVSGWDHPLGEIDPLWLFGSPFFLG